MSAMWTGQKHFWELVDCTRWKVEFFSDETVEPITIYPVAAIGDLVSERRESIEPQASPDREFNYVGLENIQSLTGDLIEFKPRFGYEILSRSKVFRTDDILYGRLRPYLNKVFVASPFTLAEGICSTEFLVLKAEVNIVRPLYLRTILASNLVLDVVKNYQSGTALPRLHKNDLLSVKIPVPPLEVQIEIEQLLVQSTEHRRKLTHELEELPQRTMAQVTTLLQGEKRLS